MEALIRDKVGCTIHDKEWRLQELEAFKEQKWKVVWFRNEQGIIRFPKTNDEEIKELQREQFEELSKEGNKLCLTDLMINAGM